MSTTTPKGLLRGLDERDGHTCAWTGMTSDTLVPQHRQGRGMGGSKAAHRLSNLVWLDSTLNGLIESDPAMQAEAVRRGIKVSRYEDIEEAKIEHAVHGLCRLLDDGTVVPVEQKGWAA